MVAAKSKRGGNGGAKGAGDYTGRSISVLKGLEPVRRRPAMYIGGVDARGLHHLIWEVLDNSIDEAINGYATTVEVKLDKDGQGIEVIDNGRGIPVDKHPETKRPTLETILTTLHAGGKFDSENYRHSGGLHGVGSSVVNALSKKMVAKVRRDGSEYVQEYRRGKPLAAMRKTGRAKGSGTSIHFRPDDKIFPKVVFDPKRIRDTLEARAYLHQGLRIVWRDVGHLDDVQVRGRHQGIPCKVDQGPWRADDGRLRVLREE